MGSIPFLGTLRDDAISESEERYRALLDRSTGFIYGHDLDRRFLNANDADLFFLGYNRGGKSERFAGIRSAREVLPGVQYEPAEYRLRRDVGRQVVVKTLVE